MKIMITGAAGFVGKNLVATLEAVRHGKDHIRGLPQELELLQCYRDTTQDELETYCAEADLVVHLAGVNRPQTEIEFQTGNGEYTRTLTEMLRKRRNPCPILLSSSIQAECDNAYGRSKRAAEKIVRDYSRQTGAACYIYRLPNLFGKWCRPNYNSAVATFCHNIARDMPIRINDPNAVLTLCYIDDVLDEFCRCLQNNPTRSGEFCVVPVTHAVSLERLAAMLRAFHNQPRTLLLPEIPDGSFDKKLYSTYLSYLPPEAVSIPLKMNCDARGSFTELLKTETCGQISVNISKPGVTKGQHWHHSKWEFFIVVSGQALIQQRKLGTDEVLEFRVSGEKLEAVHMLPGYTHNLINLSDTEDLVTVMWANERFNPQKPDTVFEEV